MADVAFTVHVLALTGEEGVMNFFAAVSHGDGVPIGVLTTHRDDELRMWLSLQQLFQTFQKYMGRPARITQVLDVRAGDLPSVEAFIKLFEIDQPVMPPGPLEPVRAAFLSRIMDQVGEASGNHANP